MPVIRPFLLISGLLWLLVACRPAEPAAAPTATPLPATASPTETAVPARPLFTITIPAPSLANNMLGEPAERQIAVSLPPSYYQSEQRYPVIYYLAGYEESWSDAYVLHSLRDQLVADGIIQEMILIVASGDNLLGGSFYVDSPVTGNWEAFIVNDLVAYVDETYRTIAETPSRGIAGFSMGGFGALNLAMRHPDVFSAVYALSPGLFAPDGLSNSQMYASPRVMDSFLALQAELAALPREEAHEQFIEWANSHSGDLRFTVAYGAAFAPDPAANAPYVAYPYPAAGGEADPAVWSQWENGFGGITGETSQYRENLLSLNGIVIDYGTNDAYGWIPAGCQFLSQELTAQNIPHQLFSFPGGHGNVTGRAEEIMLPFFSEVLAFNHER